MSIPKQSGSASTAPRIDYDPFSVNAMSDPYALYGELRSQQPVYELPHYEAFALSRFEDVWRVIGDAEGFSVAEGPVFVPEMVARPWHPERLPAFDPARSFASWDPPAHTQLRTRIRGFFTPRATQRLEALARRIARERLDVLVPTGRLDVVRDYAAHVAVGLSCHVLGVSLSRGPELVALSNLSQRREAGRAGQSEAGQAAHVEIFRHMLESVAARRDDAAGAPCVADALLEGGPQGEVGSDEQVATQLTTLLVGGTETVPKIVAGGVRELALDPAQRSALHDAPDLVGDAFEEMVRHQGVLQSVGRTALAACEVGGRRIERGQRLFLLLQSANRDEREFESPERFDIRRRPRRHLGFGHGPHHCPGIHMARLEGRVLVEELLARIPEWQVDEANCERPPSDFQLGYVSLPIVF